MNGEWQEYTQEFTDEETGIHITVKYDIPDYPLVIGVMPDGYVLTDKGNEALKRLLAQAGLPKGVPARMCYLGECTHHGKLWDEEKVTGMPALPGQMYPPPAPAPGQPAGAQQPGGGQQQ